MAKSAYPGNAPMLKPKGKPWYVYLLVVMACMFLLTTGVVIYIWKVSPGATQLVIWNRDGSNLDGRTEFNILVAGLDGSAGATRTDSIIVAHVDLKDKYANLISIPRDSRVEIPGYGKLDKINSAYSRGGPDLTIKTIENFLGARIDFYFIVRIEAAIRLVDALGGVDIDVEKNMYYRDRHQNLYIDLKKGYQHLNGRDAIGYARFRHDAAGDFGRIERQQKVIAALSQKIKSFEFIKHMPSIITQLVRRDLAYTNLTVTDGLILSKAYNEQLSRNIKTYMLPGVPQTISGISYVLPDETEIPYMVGGLLKGGFSPRNRLVKLAVLNGCGAPMISQVYKRRLEYFGFDIIRTDNARDFDNDTTKVIVRKRNPFSEPIAKLLGAELIEEYDPESISDIDVVLGRDKLDTY